MQPPWSLRMNKMPVIYTIIRRDICVDYGLELT